MLPDLAALERLSLPDAGRQQQQLSDDLPDQPGPDDTRTAARCLLPRLAIPGVTTVGSPATLPRAVSHQGGAHATHTPAVQD
jgi:hypothetical protein